MTIKPYQASLTRQSHIFAKNTKKGIDLQISLGMVLDMGREALAGENAMQAIVTKYLGPTNTRGARIKAYTYAASVTVRWDHGLSDADNYRQAAMALVAKHGWPADNWISGGAPDGYGYVFVRAS